jgi:hypothetical protein
VPWSRQPQPSGKSYSITSAHGIRYSVIGSIDLIDGAGCRLSVGRADELSAVRIGGVHPGLARFAARAAGPAVDTVQSVVVTGWITGIAGGGIVAGVAAQRVRRLVTGLGNPHAPRRIHPDHDRHGRAHLLVQVDVAVIVHRVRDSTAA